MFSIRGLRLYFPELEPWVAWSALLPAVCPVYLCSNVGLRCATRRSACPVLCHSESGSLVYLCANVGPLGATCRPACPALCHSESGPLGLSVCECRAAGAASGQTACPIGPTLLQSRSRRSNASPLRCLCPPLLPVWMNVYFLFPWCWTSLLFDFLSVLVVRGGAVCPPTPPSWFSRLFVLLNHLTSSPIPTHPPSIWQPSKTLSMSMILTLFFLFAQFVF